MYTDVESLRRQDLNLTEETQRSITEGTILRVRQFIEECRKTGKYISDTKDREDARALLLRWGEFLYQHSDSVEYLDLSLLPYDEGKVAGKAWQATWPKIGGNLLKALRYLSRFAYIVIIYGGALILDLLLLRVTEWVLQDDMARYPLVATWFDRIRMGLALLTIAAAFIHGIFSMYSYFRFEIETARAEQV